MQVKLKIMKKEQFNAEATADYSALADQCSIQRAADVFGDGWTILILRELFWGQTRYDQIAARTGIASNILAARLKKLVENEIIEKSVVESDARRFDYTLTQKGRELFPVLMTVMAWGDRWSSGEAGPLVQLRHTLCGKRTRAGLVCSACAAPLTPETLRTNFAAAYKLSA
jgi:DNA-binding HxlR family transcriptional regulator